jgi:hypothetical integral membrane protein (TIGR02206 family)
MHYPQSFIESQAPFIRFGMEHFFWILLGVVTLGIMVYLARHLDSKTQERIGWYHALFTITVWVLTNIVVYQYQGFYWRALLPFHLCYFFMFVLPFLHYYRSYLLFEITYFWIMAGSLQGLITADLDECFPHYYNIRYFVVHLGLVMSVLYATWVYHFVPTWHSLGKAFVVGNVYMAFAHGINLWLGTNFMYTIEAPPKTILDLFGTHYLFWGEFLALGLFALLLLPYWKKNETRILGYRKNSI